MYVLISDNTITPDSINNIDYNSEYSYGDNIITLDSIYNIDHNLGHSYGILCAIQHMHILLLLNRYVSNMW